MKLFQNIIEQKSNLTIADKLEAGNGITKFHLSLLLILWALVHFFLFKHLGIRSLYDSEGYVEAADFFVEYGDLMDIHHIFYSVPILLMAGFRALFPEQIIPYLIFQCMLSGIAMFSLYLSSAKIFKSKLAGLLSALFFLFWLDNIHWNITTMTESLACSVSCFLLYRLVLFKGSLKDFGWVVALLVIGFFIRPTGVVMILGTLAFLFYYYWKAIKDKAILKFSILSGFLIIGYISANLMFAHWDFIEQYEKGNIITYMDAIEGSTLYHESLRIKSNNIQFPDHNEPPLNRIVLFAVYNPAYFLKMASLKVWYLVSSIRPYYSLVHNLYSLFWVSIIYLFYYLGWQKTKHQPIKIFTLAVIVVNCGLISISSVDWDNRFYIPMEPGLVLLAGGGATSILSFLKVKMEVPRAIKGHFLHERSPEAETPLGSVSTAHLSTVPCPTISIKPISLGNKTILR